VGSHSSLETQGINWLTNDDRFWPTAANMVVCLSAVGKLSGLVVLTLSCSALTPGRHEQLGAIAAGVPLVTCLKSTDRAARVGKAAPQFVFPRGATVTPRVPPRSINC